MCSGVSSSCWLCACSLLLVCNSLTCEISYVWLLNSISSVFLETGKMCCLYRVYRPFYFYPLIPMLVGVDLVMLLFQVMGCGCFSTVIRDLCLTFLVQKEQTYHLSCRPFISSSLWSSFFRYKMERNLKETKAQINIWKHTSVSVSLKCSHPL